MIKNKLIKIVSATTVLTASCIVLSNCGCHKKSTKPVIKFDTRGGSEIASQEVEIGEKATKPIDPTKTNQKFVDWYNNPECFGDPFNFGTPITESITLYAKWRDTVTGLKLKSNIPNVFVSQTTEWKVNDYIEIEPAGLAPEYSELMVDLSIVDKDYVENSDNRLFIKRAPAVESSKVYKEIIIRSIDNPSVSVKFPLTYDRIIDNNIEFSAYNRNTMCYSVRAADKTKVGTTICIPAKFAHPYRHGDTCCVEAIDVDGFSNCTNLTKVTFEANSDFKKLDASSFAFCANLSDIQLPDTTEWIGNRAFIINDETQTATLQNIALPSSLKVIDQNSFQCQNKLTTIDIPKSVEKIDSSAFFKCTGLTKVTIPDESAITYIGNLAFANCNNLKSISKLPKTFIKDAEQSTTTGLGNAVFANCNNLAEIGVDSENKTYKVFGDLTYGMALVAWYELDGVEYHELICYPKATGKITIGDDWNLNSLGSGCFTGCTITELTIPNTLLKMKYAAFEGCKTLTKLYLGEHYSEWKWDGTTRKPPFLSDAEEAKHSVNVNIVTAAESSYYSLIRY